MRIIDNNLSMIFMKKIYLIKHSGGNNHEMYMFVAIVIGLVQLFFGVIFLIPPFLGVIFFTLDVFNIGGKISSLHYLSTNWTGDSNAMSAAPIYLGLMAIAGTLIIHSAIKNIIDTGKSVGGINAIREIDMEEN